MSTLTIFEANTTKTKTILRKNNHFFALKLIKIFETQMDFNNKIKKKFPYVPYEITQK